MQIFMQRQLQLTQDGSHTIAIPGRGITYHSTHGAVQESTHVFIQAGLALLPGMHNPLYVFEMGFGTGLNALLTLQQAINNSRQIHYTTAELYPLQAHEYNALNYCETLQAQALQPYFMAMHTAPWNEDAAIHPLFTLHKIQDNVERISLPGKYHVVYYDAFAPDDQPELWTEKIFTQLFAMLENNGILVTYCSKGSVRRALQAAGFAVTKIPGPPGKREITRAVKIIS